jgi:hypothetical protein
MQFSIFGCLLLFATLIQAHMELLWPYPFRSRFDRQVPEPMIDYSMTSPLLGDGSNYPCKGYNTNTPFRSTVTYSAGQVYNFTLSGSATHGGGSCQLSLSYDNGATFKVIQSIQGGCPLPLTYDFIIPTRAPNGRALLAWSWFNLVGNREMYMNCVPVTIQGSSGGGISDLPNIFLANVGSKSRCKTVERQELVFPNPGGRVIYGGTVTPSSPPNPGNCQ